MNTLEVGLRGYPEAVLGISRVTLAVPADPTASDVVRELARRSPRLSEALTHPDGSPRRSTKVLVEGCVASGELPMSGTESVTILAALPCDG